MNCKEHEWIIGTRDIIVEKCKVCHKEFETQSHPHEIICNDCSNKLKICQICGFDANGKI